ncbi:unnamed protein product [Diplocarpon coronariae]
MLPQEISARLKFLDDCAHLLAATAPATSRYIMSTHHALMFETNIEPTELQMMRACGACGTIMILGWGATLEPGRKAKGKQRVEAAEPLKTMVYYCGICSRKTRISTRIPKPPGRHGKSISKSISTLKSSSTLTIPQATTIGKSNKKRSRSKNKGGLAAILARNQASQVPSSGYGLDLIDFMKKG